MRYSVLIRLKAKDGGELKDYIGEKLYKVIFSMFKEYDNYIEKKIILKRIKDLQYLFFK